MSPKEIIMMAMFTVCITGVGVGAIIGLLGIWIPNFGETGWKLFLSDLVITVAAILASVLTLNFWK